MELVVFGASGGTGTALLQQAVAAGHRVRAVTRHPEQFPADRAGVEVLQGDVTDERSVERCVTGADAVLTAAGVSYTFKPVSLYSVSARTIVAAMQRTGLRRLIAVSSAAIEPGALQGDFVLRHVIAPLIHRLGRTVYEDIRRMERIVRESGLDWTLPRPSALADGDRPGRFEASLEHPRARFTTRPDLAALMLQEVERPRFVGQAPYVVSPDAKASVLRTIWKDGIARR